MTDEKLVALLRQLHKRTMEGKLDWEETTFRNFYQVAFPEYVVKIGPSQEGELVLRLFNKDNILMEEMSENQIHPGIFDAATTMRELYKAAKRKALNTEKALDDLLAALEEGDD